MTGYVLNADPNLDQEDALTAQHFGVNLVTIYDEEFVGFDPSLRNNVQELGASTLRFPGGSATEFFFDMTDPNAEISNFDPTETLTPMDQFFEKSAELGLNATIVLPTRLAFGQNAASSIIDGTYGIRAQVSQSYLADLEAFVRQALEYAAFYGVQISAFEVGNEFWGSGQMTATEYGTVAGAVSVLVQQILDESAHPDADIAVQSTSAASRIFSSRDAVVVYVATDGSGDILTEAEALAIHTPEDLSSWFKTTLEGQGSAAAQVSQIAAALNAVQGAADTVDAVVLHYYETGGFDVVDGAREFKFNQFSSFEDQLDRADGADELDYHITEWNTRSYGADNNRGLQNASMMVETFFEMAINSVDVAQIWPLSFDRAQGLSLVDKDEDDLSIAGEMFALMSESLVGLRPVLDWSIPDQFDVHGFSADDRVVLFVSERSGARLEDISLDLSQLLEDSPYYVRTTQLWDGGAGGDDANAEPVLSGSGLSASNFDSFVFDLDPWANMRIEFTLQLPSQGDSATGATAAFAKAAPVDLDPAPETLIGPDDFWLLP